MQDIDKNFQELFMFEKLEGSGHEESFDEEKARYQ